MAERKRIEKDTLIKILDCCIEDDCQHCPNAYKDGSIAACEALARGSVVIPFAIMRETINALKAQPQWINVNDRLPNLYHRVLITGRNSVGGSFGVIKGSYDGDKAGWYRDDIGQYAKSREDVITHWMPLPEPPGDGGAAGCLT